MAVLIYSFLVSGTMVISVLMSRASLLTSIGLDEVTPWSHMDYGVTHEYLVREYQKALAAQTTQPCNRACHGCGANHLLGGPCFDYSKNLV